MKHIDDIRDVDVFIPSMPSSDRHHVISRGKRPDFYRPQDLRDKGPGKTAWVDTFEKILVGLYWRLGTPIPYAFRTPDGVIRSLDAGCIKMLLNRSPPEIEIICDADGYIEEVQPTDVMLGRYQPIKDRLIESVCKAVAEPC